MRIGIPAEIFKGESRIAVAPKAVAELKKLGAEIIIESGAGALANFSDEEFKAAGAEITSDTKAVWSTVDVVLKVRGPIMNTKLGVHEVDLLKEGGAIVSFIYPARSKELLEKFKARKITSLAMDMIPRISRAQKMDALSSMANIAGYRAVIEAANLFGRFFTGQITAAGKVPPAKVLVIGAGVAGLAAIGAAKALGAIVRAFDTRPEVKDQVESMGAEFLEVDFKEDGTGAGGYSKIMSPEFIEAEMKLFKKQAADVDIIITTALVPGTKAPILIKAEHVSEMKHGSIIVDMAAEQGGNCELTKPGIVADVNGVKIIGYTDLASRLPNQASNLYGANMVHLLKQMEIQNGWNINIDDEVVRGALVAHKGEITFPPPKPKVDPSAVAQKMATASAKSATVKEEPKEKKCPILTYSVLGILATAIFTMIGLYAPPEFLSHFTVFVIAIFVGYMVVWNVTPALHTPLMSVTNAISGIIVIGAMLQISSGFNSWVTWVATIAVLLASINIFGGFLVTRRMLKMFRK
ncbi:MAG: Re/Si-specific NAD(P)(+) transhydrogenase subunit alpha [Elusimicrobia bacterium]|nr:Re/Si-specific NAD(P)(+) transhydrogenase subunit alpha [Elusimicrobiota bacterium]